MSVAAFLWARYGAVLAIYASSISAHPLELQTKLQRRSRITGKS